MEKDVEIRRFEESLGAEMSAEEIERNVQEYARVKREEAEAFAVSDDFDMASRGAVYRDLRTKLSQRNSVLFG